MEYPIFYYYPPDYTDEWEWGLNRSLAGSMSRGTSFEGLTVGLLLLSLLIIWLLLKFLVLIVRRLWDVYQSRANDDTPGGNVLKWSALGLLLLLTLALLVAGIWPALAGMAFVVVSAGLLGYTLLSEWVDYQANKAEPLPALPDNLSIQDVITFKNEVDAAAVGVPVGI